MPFFVTLYWGGTIIQVPGVGIAYDPPRAKCGIVLNSRVSYNELVAKICDMIEIDMSQHTIDITWRHAVVFGTGFTYTATTVHEHTLEYMYIHAENRDGHIELLVEFVPVTNLRNDDVVDRVGTSTMVEHARYQSDGMGNMETGIVGMTAQVDDADVDDCASVSTERDEQHHYQMSPVASEADANCSGESAAEGSGDERANVCIPVVRSRQPVPPYVQTGLPLFRSLPCEVGSYEIPNFNVNANAWYWDEKNPTHIGLGTKFDTKFHLKTGITLWHLEAMRQYRVIESKLKRWQAVCKTHGRGSGAAIECAWEVGATQRKHDGKWEIRKWVNRHTCLGNRNSRGHDNLSSSMIALCIRHQLEKDTDYKPSAIMKFVEDRFQVVCPYKKAWYARRKAIELVFGGWEESFNQLPRYMAELQSQNPGTIVEWKHKEELSEGSSVYVFRYVFWAFGPAIEAFQLAKPVLTVDGTHLRGRFKGKLLIAVGFDANKKCLPVAFAIVDEETNESWEWFMGHIRVHVTKNEREVCIISDRHHGIIRAMNLEEWKNPPVGHHKFCLVHVRKNVLQTYKGIKVKILVWSLGVTTELRKYIRRRRALQSVSADAMRYLNNIGKERWSLTYDEELRWGEATTNMVECYNNVLKSARELPIKALVDLTFWRSVEWWIHRMTEIQQTRTMISPWAMKKLNANDKWGQGHRVTPLSRLEGLYQVKSRPRPTGKGNNKQTVEYMNSKCSCGKWQMWRIPCSHAAAVVRDRGDDMFDLVDRVYHKDVWELQYSGVFHPLRHEDYWEEADWELCVDPDRLLPRETDADKNRMPNQMDVREADEERAPRRCRNCGEPGHNSRSCSSGRTM